ncbi:MAG TPA: chorismate synthase [Candidatus Dormibacteraeota bacterium]|jgi:chorismate synthase|nr:chorismate synthase [Candidatus Dormibacteraeota bacterium]
MLRFLTAGESHGPQLTVMVEGLPAGLALSAPRDIDDDLRRRQGGYGRGGRQKIEQDAAQIVSGVRGGRTLGSPVTLVIPNKDWENWRRPMQVESGGEFIQKKVTRVRPGHADLAGALKYGFDDVRNVLERASARETAARVAAGAVAKAVLKPFGISVRSYVRRIGDVEMHPAEGIDWDAVERSEVRCPDPEASQLMIEAIDAAREAGDTLGGICVVIASGVPAGLGSYVQWDRRLDGQIAQAMCSIQSVKGVELGAGFDAAYIPGSRVHDSPRWIEGEGFRHLTNRQGGLTGGVSDGEDIWTQVYFKPIATLLKPLRSVDLHTREEINAHYERSDICVVPAGGVVAEAMLAWVLAAAFVEKFGGDSLAELKRNVAGYKRQLAR